MLRAPFVVVLLACSVACSATTQAPAPEKSPPRTASAPDPAPAKLSEPVPDPITRPLDEHQAQAEASRLAEQAFADRKDIVDAAGRPVGPHKFPPEEFVGGLEHKRWKLRNEPPAGAWARVSFGEFGTDPQVEVGFASH